jgi:uncharacterized protein (TIGR03083 family)
VSVHGQGWLDAGRYVEVIASEGPKLLPFLRREPGRHVPTCPGWSVQDLIGHLGISYWRASERIRIGGTEQVDLPEYNPPARLTDLEQWYEAGLVRLFEQFANKDPEAAAWSWGGDHRVAWWQRRLCFKSMIHRVDASLAFGEPHGIWDGALAADCVTEALTLPIRSEPYRGPRGSFLLVAQDRPEWETSAWTIRLTKDGVERIVERTEGLDEAIGSAAEIALVLWRRRRSTTLKATFKARSLVDSFAKWHDIG